MSAAGYTPAVPVVAASSTPLEAATVSAVAGATAEPASQFDARVVREEADGVLQRARAEAEAIVNDARAQAGGIVADAQSRADAIENTARKSGFEKGECDGRAAVDDELADMVAGMRSVVEMARAERHRIIESAEPELVKLALAVAERVVHAHIALEPEAVIAMARTALQHLVERESVTVRVNPADLQTLRSHRDDLLARHDMSDLHIVEDRRVDRGGVVIETASGSIDAKVGSQLLEARRALHVEEPVDIAPADDLLRPAARAS